MSELPLEKRLEAFQSLSNKVSSLILNWESHLDEEPDPILKTVRDQVNINPWFTEQQVIRAMKEWVILLDSEKLADWVSDLREDSGGKIIALIPAGNIPLVGFHDVLSVLISGHSLLLRPSTDDPDLIPLFLLMLQQIEPSFKEKIRIADGKLSAFDAVIATGSNNSARYFDYYFGKYPHIIRKNRTSIAVLTGEENEEEIQGLADDIMAYFGLGCRSVTKVYVPRNYDLDNIFKALYVYRGYLNCKPFADNYDYHRSLWMMNNIEFLENGFMLLREESSIHSPVSALHYEYYDDISSVANQLKDQEEEIQVVISKSEGVFPRQAMPGQGQQPRLDDYADGVNTLDFLNSL
jgi:hypothetical protein